MLDSGIICFSNAQLCQRTDGVSSWRLRHLFSIFNIQGELNSAEKQIQKRMLGKYVKKSNLLPQS
jgi:hypothetical protein